MRMHRNPNAVLILSGGQGSQEQPFLENITIQALAFSAIISKTRIVKIKGEDYL